MWQKLVQLFLNIRHINNYNLGGMSSIIDEAVFIGQQNGSQDCRGRDVQVCPQNFCRVMKCRDQPFLIQENYRQIQAFKRIDTPHSEHLVKLTARKVSSNTTVIAVLLGGAAFHKILSKQLQILFQRELLKRQRQCPTEANFCIHEGRVILVLNNLLLLTTLGPHQMAKIYMQYIAKNLAHFAEIQQKFLKISKRAHPPTSCNYELHQQLILSNFLCTTQSNADLSGDRSQYRFAMREIEKQNCQLYSIQKNIIADRHIVHLTSKIFLQDPLGLDQENVSSHLIPLYRKNIKFFKHLLEVPIPVEKRAQDYLHSIVQVKILQKLSNKPLGEGGTSVVYPFKALITFNSQEKIEKHIVIKMLNSKYQCKKKSKIDHQKAIVSKLTNSVCHFLPKYYATQSNQLKNCLIMELIRGQDLDIFIAKHPFLSFWSKMYITINILQGIRHLINHGIVQLDLKPSNIFVCSQLFTKIIDYGEAYHKDVCQQDYVPGYTFPYVAPEVVSHIIYRKQKFQYDQKQDAFAFGIILSQIFFNDSIFCFSNNVYREVYESGQQLQRCIICPQRLQAFGNSFFMSILLQVIEKCIGEPFKRPRFEWISIILRLMHDSFINNY